MRTAGERQVYRSPTAGRMHRRSRRQFGHLYSCLCVMLMSPLLQYMCCNSLLGDVVSAPKSCNPKQSLNHCHCPAVQLKETLLDENARMFDVSGDAGEGEGGESPTPRSIVWSCKGASQQTNQGV